MSLHWYACISTNTCCFKMHHISLETDWWALSNASSIVWIRSAVHEILADKAFIATDGLISQSFVVAFVHPTYVQIALIWGFPAQLSLWKSVHWLWRYKLNEVCDRYTNQHSLPSQTSSLHLKLQPCSRQIVQHISWSQDYSTSLHISEPILQTFTSGVNYTWYVPSVYYIVATSDKRKKSEMEVSADWCITIEHWKLSSIRVIFINY